MFTTNTQSNQNKPWVANCLKWFYAISSQYFYLCYKTHILPFTNLYSKRLTLKRKGAFAMCRYT